MPDEPLDINERYKLLRKAQAEYRRADRARRSRMLDDLETYTGLTRKSLIRRLNGSCERRPRRRQRGHTYGPRVDDALRVIAEAHDFICAERLQPNLVEMAEQLARHDELVLDEALREQLGTISVSTVRRRLAIFRQDEPRLKRHRRPPSARRQGVPIGRIPWDEPLPGHLEVDLVHHCGPQTVGEYVYTLHLVDVTTGWSEAAAVLGRSYLVVGDGLRRCLGRLPFAVHEVHTDNGGEFFTDHLERFFAEGLAGASRSRSRPYRKNDSRFVEQRNGDLIRGYLGDERLDTAAQTRLLNAFYEKLRLYFDFFQPVLRLEAKEPSADGRGIKRRFSPARTPFARLCAVTVPGEKPGEERPLLEEDTRRRLEELRQSINPRALRRELQELLQELWRLPGATPGRTEDVWTTLYDPSVIIQKGEGDPPVPLSDE